MLGLAFLVVRSATTLKTLPSDWVFFYEPRSKCSMVGKRALERRCGSTSPGSNPGKHCPLEFPAPAVIPCPRRMPRE